MHDSLLRRCFFLQCSPAEDIVDLHTLLVKLAQVEPSQATPSFCVHAIFTATAISNFFSVYISCVNASFICIQNEKLVNAGLTLIMLALHIHTKTHNLLQVVNRREQCVQS